MNTLIGRPINHNVWNLYSDLQNLRLGVHSSISPKVVFEVRRHLLIRVLAVCNFHNPIEASLV